MGDFSECLVGGGLVTEKCVKESWAVPRIAGQEYSRVLDVLKIYGLTPK